MTARRFSIEIDREFAECMGEVRAIVGKTALEALSRVVQRTPVDTGRARGNWFVSFGSAENQTTALVDPSGSATISKGAAKIGTYRRETSFPKIVLYNNLPYIGRLEDGYSTQAPTGMVAITAMELNLRAAA